ncbi:MAG: hypothetical protein ACRC80_13485 [Waterburya sp.]
MSNYSQTRRCIIDPSLALSHYGSLIVENLGKEVELWIGREMWNILKNIDFYLHRPDLIIPQHRTYEQTSTSEFQVLNEVFWSLREWNRVRQNSDLARLNLFWLGDSLQESFLPANRTTEVFKHWESLAHSLDNYISQPQSSENVLTSAVRDTVALSVCLGSASILTYQLPTLRQNLIPDIGLTLQNWGIPCQMVQAKESIIAIERQHLRQSIVNTGLAKLLCAGVRLAIFHLVIPAMNTSANITQRILTTNLTENRNYSDRLISEDYFWRNVRGFWYLL